MDGMQIIGHLEEHGVKLSLAIDYEIDGEPKPEVESLLRKLSEEKDAAIDYFLSKRIVPLPDNTPLPVQSRSVRMKQIAKIFRVCFDMIEKHEGSKTEAQFKAAADYHEGRLDPNDQLARDLNRASYTELSRQ